MHKVLVRLKLIKENLVYEVYLDDRLNFKENILILGKMLDKNLNDLKVYDPNKKIFLNTNIKIKEYSISDFICLYLF